MYSIGKCIPCAILKICNVLCIYGHAKRWRMHLGTCHWSSLQRELGPEQPSSRPPPTPSVVPLSQAGARPLSNRAAGASIVVWWLCHHTDAHIPNQSAGLDPASSASKVCTYVYMHTYKYTYKIIHKSLEIQTSAIFRFSGQWRRLRRQL